MALFNDGNIARLEDLVAHESAVLDLTSAEGLDIPAKLALAQREIGTELLPFLALRGCRDLSMVVVTDALVSVHALRSLATIYRDLYQSRFNDRYEGKWREYAAQSERAMKALLDCGVGVTTAPIPKADKPIVETVSGGSLPSRTYYIRTAWIRGSKTTGALSDAVSASLSPAAKVTVRSSSVPDGATGWVVYAGVTPVGVTLQTDEPIKPDCVWTESDAGLRTDLSDWPEQTPEFYLENRRRLLRG